MSILINMEMPKSCPCSLLGVGYDLYCFAVNGIPKRYQEYNLCCENGTRPDWCPLVEVPDPDEDKAFRRGAEAAWEAARKIMTREPYDGGFDCMELEEIFDFPNVSKDIGSILEKFDAITAMYKIADYERKKADATHDIH